jgi:hypothetical protein
MQSKTPLIVTLLASIVFGLLSFFGYSPDPQLINDTYNYAGQAQNAISVKNWIALGTSTVSFAALVYVWWKGRPVRSSL